MWTDALTYETTHELALVPYSCSSATSYDASYTGPSLFNVLLGTLILRLFSYIAFLVCSTMDACPSRKRSLGSGRPASVSSFPRENHCRLDVKNVFCITQVDSRGPYM